MAFYMLAGLMLGAPGATAQTRSSAMGKTFVLPEFKGPTVPVPEIRERSRLRRRYVLPAVPGAKKKKKTRRRAVRRAPEFFIGGAPVLPWEEEIKRLRARSRITGPDPHARLKLALRKLYADPMLRLGYSANPSAMPKAEAPALKVPPVFDIYIGMDGNRDGAISRTEYFAARLRFLPAGRKGDARRRAQMARLKSRFRGVDLDNDGRITAQELESLVNLRF